MEDKYKLVGFINILDVVPSGLYAVYEKHGEYYGGFVHSGEPSSIYIEFFQKWRKDVLDRIVLISDIINDPNYSLVLNSVKPYYQVGDGGVYAYQLTDNNIYLGNLESFLDFLKNLESDIKEVMNSGNEKTISAMYEKYNITDEDSREIYLAGLHRDIKYLEKKLSRKV